MTSRHASQLAWVVVAVSAALFAIGGILDATNGPAEGPAVFPFAPVFLAFAIVGALIVSRRPGNAVGWLALIEAAMGAVGGFVRGYADYGVYHHHLPGAVWAAWFSVVGIEFSVTLPLMLLLFPDGRLPSPRWRVVVWVAIVGWTLGIASTAIADVNFHTNYPTVLDPVRLLPKTALQPLYGLYQSIETATFALAAVSLFIRYRHAGGEERAQLKWVAYATVIAMGGIVTMALVSDEPVFAFVVLVPLIPISIGIAILKYRLYDIDLVISKTVVFALLAAFITSVYVAIVVGFGELSGNTSSPALSIAATVIVAVLFQPVRGRANRLANRLVYGERATPYEVMAGFSERVADAVSTDEVLPQMAEAAGRGVGAVEASVRVRLPDGLERVERWSQTDGRADRADAPWTITVAYQGEPVGDLTVTKPANEPLTPAEQVLLRDLGAQAGLALHNVRLTEELAIRLRELDVQAAALRLSRERLVTARDAQRRGLQRDIHEGPEHQLLDIGRKLATVEVPDQVDPLIEQANHTLEGLRDLARGIFPPLLAEQGVVAALGAHIRKVGARATVHASEAFRARRFDPDTEACVYFCCLQAIQNVIRHAANASCVVRLDLDGDAIAFEIRDGGPGFDVASTPRGMGLQIVQDRVDALEGSLRVTSEPAAGTVVLVRLPIHDQEEVRV